MRFAMLDQQDDDLMNSYTLFDMPANDDPDMTAPDDPFVAIENAADDAAAIASVENPDDFAYLLDEPGFHEITEDPDFEPRKHEWVIVEAFNAARPS